MTDLLIAAHDGGVADRIVEKMFSDLYHGTYAEDDITLHNFNIYVQEMYNVSFDLKSFDNTALLIEIIAQVFGEVDYIQRSPGKYRVEFKSWGGKYFVQGDKLGVVLAQAIVQSMRIRIKAQFEGKRH